MTPFFSPRKITAPFLAFLCVAFGFTLQIQVTLFKSPDYLGLRLNLADILLLPAAFGALLLLFWRTVNFPCWLMKGLYFWIAALTFVLIAAFAHTYFAIGEISRWALINKIAGWVVLMGLMGLGGFLASNATEKHIVGFLRALVFFATLGLAVQSVAMILHLYPDIPGYESAQSIKYPIAGLMANRNSYAFFFLAIYAFATIDTLSARRNISIKASTTLYFLLPFFIVFNGSRAAILTLAVILPVMFVLRRKHGRQAIILLGTAILGTVTLFAFCHDRTDKLAILYPRYFEIFDRAFEAGKETLNNSPYSKSSLSNNDVVYIGDKERLAVLNSALNQFYKNPLFGSGLGAIMLEQRREQGRVINIVDCTPLWLLVETGLAGFFLFAAFFVKVVFTLLQQMKQDDALSVNFRLSMLMVLLAFCGMCLFHELTYARHMWFLLGMALCLPPRMRQDG